MEKKHRNVLQTNFAYLIKNLHNVEAICDELLADHILTSGMNESIQHKTPRPTEQTRELLSILPRRGMNAYKSFISALNKTGNGEVADHLIAKDGSKNNEVNSDTSGKKDNALSKPKNGNGDTQETEQHYSENPEKTKKLESQNYQGWPDLLKGLPSLNKRDIVKCTEDLRTKICKSKHGKVYHMTGKKKGKVLTISNVQCSDQSIEAKAVNRCRSCVDFDKTSLSQLFTYMQYETKQSYTKRDVSEEEMKTFLATQLENEDNSTFDSLVIVFYSGGMEFKPDCIYDTNGKEIDKDGILEMIRQSKYFKDKPKIVIIRTYDFKEETETGDVLDAVSHELHFYKRPNKDDLFVVSSQPRTKKGPWIIGDEMNGSYFIQAIIQVFKKMAHEKSFMEMMVEVNNCLASANMPKKGKQAVAEVMVLEHSDDKDLFFYPGLKDLPMIVPEWPDLTAGGNNVQKKDVISHVSSEWNFYTKIKNEEIYSMTSANRGKFILISNVQCIPCLGSQNEEDKKEAERCAERYSECIRNSDFDKSNMSQLLKYMGYDFKAGDQVENLSKEEIKEFLKTKLEEIDNDTTSQYDSMAILFLSGEIKCEAAKIYDKEGVFIPRNEILNIVKECKHFKGKPKVIFVQTYSFQDKTEPLDQTDSTTNDIIKRGEPNTDDIFMVSSYPRIEQGPWIIGENMIGSYFIQALVHVFKNFAYKKSFMELLKEANICLDQTLIPKVTVDGKNSGTVEKKPVAQIVLLEYSEDKELYFFPGLEFKLTVYKGVEPVNLSTSMSGLPVTTAS
ncbi:caspase-2-like isoform X2 [Mytilus galloprovincialis]|uniref:caspase-2-like isoform X2 n=1 Tax=Mytilus galloprovincialis TaxID=29158 RepID=UPI003F7CAA1E